MGSIGHGFSRATVTKVSLGAGTVSVKIPSLGGSMVYADVPFYGSNPSVNDELIVGYLTGSQSTPIAISISGGSSLPTSAAEGDIEGVTAGLGLSGGGTTGTVSLAFAPSELSSVTVATDDKVVIADTSDSDNPKHVTAQSIANLASTSPGGSDHQVQFNDNNSFGGDANFTYDGSAVGLGATLTVGANGTGHDVKFFGDTTGKYMEWDQSDDQLDVTGKLDVTGETTITNSTGNYTLIGNNPNEQIKLTSDNNSGRPFLSFNNQDASGNLDRKGYIGFPEAASDSSAIYIRSDQGVIDMGATQMTSLTLSGDADFNGALDVDGTTNLDVVDIDGAVDMASTLTVNSHTFLADHVQTGRTSFVVEPWSSSTIALGDFGSVGTQGSYRTALAWNYERGADGNFHHLDVNSYPQAGDFSIGNTGFIFNFDTDYESAHTTNPTAVASVNTDGQIHAIKGGADGGIVLGQTFSTGYVGLRTANMSSTGSEYIIMSAGGHTLISAGTGGAVYIRANANDSTNELLIGNGTLNIDFDDYVVWETPLPVVSGYSTLRRKNSNNIVGYDGSSIRYKENVTNFVKSDWEKIYNLQAVRFNWKKEIDEDQNRSWGFISEDVYAEIPELGVMRVVEGVNDGNPVPDTVNYEQMCVFLVEAVKDLNTRLAALE